MGEFADNEWKEFTNGTGGLAKTGLGIDLLLEFPLGSGKFSLIGNAACIYNPGDINAIEDGIEDSFYWINGNSDYSLMVDIENFYWLNIPIMGGIKFDVSLSKKSELYFLAELGLNLAMISELEYSYTLKYNDFGAKDEFQMTKEFAPSPSFGGGIGVGINIVDHLRLSLKYLNLGNSKISYDYLVKDSGDEKSGENEIDKKISMLTFTLGYTF